jgi:hypothetical protein
MQCSCNNIRLQVQLPPRLLNLTHPMKNTMKMAVAMTRTARPV